MKEGDPAAPAAADSRDAPRPDEKEFPCRQCGGRLEYRPGTSVLKCPYCGFENPIPQSEEEVQELDYRASLAERAGREEVYEALTVKCDSCGAETTLSPGVTAAACSFCGSNLVATARSRSLLKPKALLPFKVTRGEAVAAFGGWLRSLWFAPGELKTHALADHRFTGVYVPYWTYDCDATSFYRGERGDDYWVTQHYTAHENGRTVTRTRQVRQTRWTAVSGTVFDSFDDILVLASRSLPRSYADKLEPWDLKGLVPYGDDYLSGFRAQSYELGLEEGFGVARGIMEARIRQTVCRDIGGDHQRIQTVKTRYDGITFKHVLLPVWMSAYRYRDRVFRFLVNARTGEVQGERPWSAAKIALLVLLVLAVLAALAAFIASRQ